MLFLFLPSVILQSHRSRLIECGRRLKTVKALCKLSTIQEQPRRLKSRWYDMAREADRSRVIEDESLETYGGSNISLQLLCKKATPACECQHFIPLSLLHETPLVMEGMLVAEWSLTAKKATAVTTERLSGEARLVYTWLMAPGWFERLGAIVFVICGICVARVRNKLSLNVVVARGNVGSTSSPDDCHARTI